MEEYEEPIEGGEPQIGNEEEYLDEEDIAEGQDRMEDQHDDVENVEWADVPQQKRTEGLYQLFNKVLKSQDNSKVANLDKYELGPQPFMNVRNSQFLALCGKTVHHKKFGEFFVDLSEITLKTSASKKGWFTELFVSQKKQTTRFSGQGGGLPGAQGMASGQTFGQQPFKKKRFGIFGGSPDQAVE
jgi:hypothetical protein